jgi:prophage regulatory protein
MQTPIATPDRIINRAEFRELTGLSRTKVWRMEQENATPPPVTIDGRTLGYRLSDYTAWLESRTATCEISR